MTERELDPKIARDILEMHHEHLLERAQQRPEIAKACHAVIERERSLFAYLWTEPKEG